MSEEGKDFVRQMLIVDPDKRSTIDSLLKHPWLKSQEQAAMVEESKKLATLGKLKDTNTSMKKLKASFMAATFAISHD